MTTIVQSRIRAGYEPIPGYVLEEVIGRGGFGEVWRASAPGGLKKAVKFVFGDQDSDRSMRERRSLERLCGVQHPFLLTLERYETIENQLVIVTELADGSLEDLVKKFRETGSCGIPHDTLIGHMQDTADALDYLHKNYQLQHLDIKPGNLLIIGGHVKVADFGLLKELRDAECSIVGGLTPVYAPPELFDGRPSMHSDQYSLAVMYQELLTGTRPFTGRSIAQLATQHIHSAPNLEPLPPSDRPAVARALEKDPQSRFDTCQQFVDAIRHARSGKRHYSSAHDTAHDMAQVGEFDHIGSVEDLPQLADGVSAVATNRTSSTQVGTSLTQEGALVVALGGTGADCLRSLYDRSKATHNDGRLSLHSVLIDTNMATLGSIRESRNETSVGPCEFIYTPLKTAREYREAGTERLRSISRRWIYNVPRNATTEGMRPLGRLALVDHGEMVTKQLTRAVKQLAEERTNATPRVYVVGSLTGGTSSGMYLDIVHLLRNLLDNAGMEHVNILSMLTTVAIQADLTYPLALYDANAALIEMNHFLKAGNGYPGDAGAGWPSVPAARTPLHQVYVIAEPQAGSLSPSPVETIVDYVWADSTGAGNLLASARKEQDSEKSSLTGPTLLSVGVIPLSDANRMREKILAPTVAKELLVRWLGLPSTARVEAVSLSARITRRIGLKPKAMVETVAGKLNRPVYQEWIANAVASLSDQDRQDWNCVKSALENVIDAVVKDDDFKKISSDVMSRFFGYLSVALTDRAADVTTIIETMKLIQADNLEAAEKLRSDSHDCSAPADPEAADREAADREVVEIAVSHLIAASQLEHINECLSYLQQRFERFATTLALGIVQVKKLQGVEANPWDILPDAIKSEFDSTVIQLHQSSANQFMVRTLVDQAANIDVGAMVNRLHDVAISLVESVMEEHDPKATGENSTADSVGHVSTTSFPTVPMPHAESLSKTLVPHQIQAVRSLGKGGETLTVDQAVVAAKPSLLEFGGQQRLILVVGNEREREQFESQVREAHDGPVTVSVVPGALPKLIHEARRIELSSLLSRMKRLNGDNAQVTDRLSSRSDVTW